MSIDSEKMKYSDNSQHSEYDKTVKEEKWQYSQQVNYAVKGYKESHSCLDFS